MLATMLSNSLSKSSINGRKTVVLEEGGHPISLGLNKRDPFATDGCKFKYPKCIMRPNKDCSMMSSVYVIRCIKCKEELDPNLKENPALPGGIRSSHYLGMTATIECYHIYKIKRAKTMRE